LRGEAIIELKVGREVGDAAVKAHCGVEDNFR
jgi:hypothetical protein